MTGSPGDDGGFRDGGLQLLRHFGRGAIVLDARDLVALEEHGQPLALRFLQGADLQRVEIVPAVLVEGIGQHRRPEQEAHLGAGHADLHLGHLPSVEEIALLDGHAVDATAGRQQEDQQRGQPKRSARQGRADGRGFWSGEGAWLIMAILLQTLTSEP